MKSLMLLVVAEALAIGLPALGVPLVLTVLVALPFALGAGRTFADHGRGFECGWCGGRFTGPYDWCCPTCAEEVRP